METTVKQMENEFEMATKKKKMPKTKTAKPRVLRSRKLPKLKKRRK